LNLSSRLDAFALAVAPAWGAARLEARRRIRVAELTQKHFEARLSSWEAADHGRFRGAKWLISRISSNSALESEWETLAERSEDLYRNDAWAASAINGRVDNVVGRGIRVQSRIQPEDVGLDEDTTEVVRNRLESLWHETNRSINHRSKQRQAERCSGIFGESIEILSDVGAADKPVPLDVQVINPKRCQTPPNRISDKRIRMGVEVDASGKPVAYWIRKTDPSDSVDINEQYDRIPAERVLHTFEPLFPGQLRGVPWMAPGMGILKDLKDFCEAALIQEQTAALFSAFIKGPDPHGSAAFNATDTTADSRRIEDMHPGTIQYLGPDDEITFSNPNRPGNTLAPYVLHHLKAFASSIRYPFELLTKTYDNSYSGGRLSLIDGRVAFGCWQQCRIDMSCAPLWHRFVDECVILGLVPEIDPADYRANPWPWRRHQWIPPGMEWIDPRVDAESNRMAVEDEFKTKGEIIAALGGDYDEVLQARTREKIAAARAEKRYQDELARLGLASDPETGKPGPPAPEPAAREPVGAAA
jgi:lambda family phage portal protein